MNRPAYTFLMSVLFIGAIATAVSGSVMLLGWRSMRNGQALEESSQAFAQAFLCSERALMNLLNNTYYSGDESIVQYGGECYILPVGGAGNENRTVCAEGVHGDSVRRLEVIVERILPSVRIFSW